MNNAVSESDKRRKLEPTEKKMASRQNRAKSSFFFPSFQSFLVSELAKPNRKPNEKLYIINILASNSQK